MNRTRKAKGTGKKVAIYDSRHGATRKITAAAMLVELICERIATHQGRTLPARFWITQEWKPVWNRQATFAASLLKLYDAEIVVRALRAAPDVYSLGANFFHKELRKQGELMRAEERVAASAPVIETRDTQVAPRPRVGRTGKLHKLNDLDKPNA